MFLSIASYDFLTIGGQVMLYSIIELIAKFAPMWDYILTYFVALCFIATVPCIVREVVRINV